MGGKKPSGAAKRKKKKEKEEAIERARAEVERLKLGPTALWTGLVLHHRDIFVSHVLPKLNGADRYFFSKANSECNNLLNSAGVDVLEAQWSVHQCLSFSTLEWAWNNMNWGATAEDKKVIDRAWFCHQVVATNKLELLKWVREEKKCDWDEWTINNAAYVDNLEMLKYCFANGCPYDETKACRVAAQEGHLDCLRFLFEKVTPSRDTKRNMTIEAAAQGHLDILKYCIEEKKITGCLDNCVACAVGYGELTCLKYLVEEVKAPLLNVHLVSAARYKQQHECENYLLEKGALEPTEQDYESFVLFMAAKRGER